MTAAWQNGRGRFTHRNTVNYRIQNMRLLLHCATCGAVSLSDCIPDTGYGAVNLCFLFTAPVIGRHNSTHSTSCRAFWCSAASARIAGFQKHGALLRTTLFPSVPLT